MSVAGDSSDYSDHFSASFSLGGSLSLKKTSTKHQYVKHPDDVAYSDAVQKHLLKQQSDSHVFGVISVRIVSVDKLVLPSDFPNVYVKIITQGLARLSQVNDYHSDTTSFNSTHMLPITLNRNPRHPDNLLRVSVFQASPLNFLDPIVGSIAFNLHDIVKAKTMIGVFNIFSGDVVSGELSLSIDFYYGSLGFGYSNQLRDPTSTAPQQVERCLFPRICPPSERMDENRGTLLPRALHHPSFLEFNGNETVLTLGEEFIPKLPPPTARHRDVDSKPGECVSDGKGRFPKVEEALGKCGYKEKVANILSQNSRTSRLKLLSQYVLKERAHIVTNQNTRAQKSDQERPSFFKYLRPAKDILPT
ncbi:hypothetical protein RCL1_000886 [Eukaryota sp. TZLM3-RCL]